MSFLQPIHISQAGMPEWPEPEKYRNMHKYILLFCTLLFSIQLQGQEMLSISDAIAIGLERNFDVQIAKNDRTITENNYTRGNAGFLPRITWSGARNYSRQNVKQEFITGSTNEKNRATSNTWNTGIDAGWTIFDGMKMFRTYDKLYALKEIGVLDEQIAIENTVFDIALAYYNVLLQKSRIGALDTTLILSRERVDLAQTRYEVGKAPKLDYLSAQVDYNTDYSALLVQEESLEQAKHDLNNLMGRDIKIDFDIPNDISLDSTLAIDQLRQVTLTGNTTLIRARRTGAVLDLEAEEIKSEKIPQVDLNLGYAYNKLSSQAGFLLSNRNSGLNYGLSATWNIFDGRNVQRRYDNALITKQTNDTRIEQLQLQVMRDLENAYLNYNSSLRLVNLERQNLLVARESVTIAVDRYRLGKSTFIELREAQVNAIRTLSRLFDAVYATKVAELELLLLSGNIVREMQ
jgi:outer membrane protein TolC